MLIAGQPGTGKTAIAMGKTFCIHSIMPNIESHKKSHDLDLTKINGFSYCQIYLIYACVCVMLACLYL